MNAKGWIVGVLLVMVQTIGQAQQVSMVKWAAMDSLFAQKSDTTYVLNFWATWCKPCVTELPYFEQTQQKYLNQKLKVILVSMDFARELTTRVVPFVTERKLTSQVWLLNEPDANSWIEKVSKEWSGAIPATLIFNNAKGKKVFFEQKLDALRLEKELSDFL